MSAANHIFERTDGLPVNHFFERDLFAKQQERHAELVERLHPLQDVTGLNMPRIWSYLDDEHISRGTLTVIDERRRPEVRRIVAEVMGKHAVSNAKGMIFISTHAGYVLRDYSYEQRYGTESTEAYIVHEYTHGREGNVRVSYAVGPERNNAIAYTYGNGLANISTGAGRGFEEAAACIKQAKYMRTVIGRPNGIVNRRQTAGYGNLPIGPGTIPMSYVYAATSQRFWGSWGAVHCIPSALPALGLECLVREDPSVEEALYAVRLDAPGSKEVLAGKINQFRPGLFDALYACDASDKGLRRFPELIIRAGLAQAVA